MHLWLWKFKENFHFPFYRNVNSNTNKVKFCPPDPVLIFPIIHAITQGYPLVHFVIQRFEIDEGDTDSVVDVIADLGRELGPISDGEQREFELLTLAETWQGDKTNLGPLLEAGSLVETSHTLACQTRETAQDHEHGHSADEGLSGWECGEWVLDWGWSQPRYLVLIFPIIHAITDNLQGVLSLVPKKGKQLSGANLIYLFYKWLILETRDWINNDSSLVSSLICSCLRK